MYGMNKKKYSPVNGGMRVQKPVLPGGSQTGASMQSGNKLQAAQKSMGNAMMRKRVLQKLRGA